MQTTPIQHWTQGAARLAQALVGGIGMNRADEQDAEGMQNAMRMYSGGMFGDQQPVAPPQAGPAPAAPGGRSAPPLAPDVSMPANKPLRSVPLDAQRPPQNAIAAALTGPSASPAILGPSAPPQSAPQQAAPAGQPGQPPAGQRPDPRLIAALTNPYLPKPLSELAMTKAKEQMKPPEYTHFTAGDKNMVFDKSNPGNVRDLGASSENKFQNVAELRKEIHTLPSYKNWTQAEPIYRSMLETEKTDSKASDLNLVYGLGKIFDPTSVVREGEMVMVKNTASLPDWLVGSINSLNGGARLQPETRKAILAEAKIRAGQYYDMVQADVAPYRGIAKRNNMHEDDIIPPIRPLSNGQAVTAPPATAAQPQPAATRPPVRVNSPLEASQLPKGTPIEFRDPRNGGAWTRGST